MLFRGNFDQNNRHIKSETPYPVGEVIFRKHEFAFFLKKYLKALDIEAIENLCDATGHEQYWVQNETFLKKIIFAKLDVKETIEDNKELFFKLYEFEHLPQRLLSVCDFGLHKKFNLCFWGNTKIDKTNL